LQRIGFIDRAVHPMPPLNETTVTKTTKTMNTTPTKAIDPICGMNVDTTTALHAECEGKTWYFCGEHCREKFLSTPADAKPEKKSGSCCCG
jgi:YHS domain-containing protein